MLYLRLIFYALRMDIISLWKEIFWVCERGFSRLPIRREKCLGHEIDTRLGAKKMLNKMLFYLTVIDLTFDVFGYKESTIKTKTKKRKENMD